MLLRWSGQDCKRMQTQTFGGKELSHPAQTDIGESILTKTKQKSP